ncbi:hypothetical protein TRFO_36514 [Tritrichomonas foetus]|uniref:Plexin repeat family protein n=1 Tax=Tritrichomonas foetus TaxID=1144522 RepID=A0A1J4JJA6_9EUKA|nr:hypothetical protein TRFO_36514 [Tritrichomonas foetus]|eukprot:OHS97316.1 hypothetical protein TRFO_36514 [Tritrichomonas foetus]
MLLINLVIFAFSSQDNICDLLTFDADTCLSVYGCEFCAETQKCFSTLDNQGNKNTVCPNSNSIVAANSKKLGRCFELYSDDGCTKCVSNDDTIHCGWCQSMSVCVEGTKDGPFAFKCIAEDWLFNVTTCKASKCAAAKNKDDCKNPCKWSNRRSTCFRPRDINSYTIEEKKQEKETAKTKKILIVVIIMLSITAASAAIVTIWYYSRPLYQSLPKMNAEFNLDDIPSFK